MNKQDDQVKKGILLDDSHLMGNVFGGLIKNAEINASGETQRTNGNSQRFSKKSQMQK